MLTGKELKEYMKKETLRAVEVNSSIDSWAKSVGITLFPNQLEIMEAILNPSVRNLVVLASRAGGKTFTISVAIVKNSIENKGYRTILTAPKADQSLRIIADGILPLCQNNPILYNEVDWEHTSKKEFRFKNGSWVRALGAGPETNVEGHHCTSGDTKILLADGTEKYIMDIKTGDKVLCFDADNNLVSEEVVATDFRMPEDNLYEVSYELDGVVKSVRCTGDHKFYTKNRGIVKAQDLTNKDILIGVVCQ